MADAIVRYELICDFDGKGARSGVDQQKQDETTTQNNQLINRTKRFFKQTVIMGEAVAVAKWQVSLVGRNMGSSLAQEKIDAGIQIGTTIATLAYATATGGPLAGLAVASAVGIKMMKDVEQYNYNARWENIELNLSRERLGTNAAINRSRNV